GGDEVQFFAVAAPSRLSAAVGRDLQLTGSLWKALNDDFEPAGFIRLVRHELPVGRILSADFVEWRVGHAYHFTIASGETQRPEVAVGGWLTFLRNLVIQQIASVLRPVHRAFRISVLQQYLFACTTTDSFYVKISGLIGLLSIRNKCDANSIRRPD